MSKIYTVIQYRLHVDINEIKLQDINPLFGEECIYAFQNQVDRYILYVSASEHCLCIKKYKPHYPSF